VARRKSALVFILLGMMVLILSPWANAPPSVSPTVSISPTLSISPGEAVPPTAPVEEKEPSFLNVAVALDEQEFLVLDGQNREFMSRHSDITVHMTRIDPKLAYSSFLQASQLGEAADVMLLRSEWIKAFAVSGYLMPADAAFVGKALAEQFDAITAPLWWNGYLWGVPRDFDPHVVVWNFGLLRSWLGDNVALPLSIEQWAAAAAKSADSETRVSWLAIDRQDPLALLAWLENAAGHRTDGIWQSDDAWAGSPLGDALLLLESQLAGISFAEPHHAAEKLLTEEQALAAVMPYSEAARILAAADSGQSLVIDHTAWKLPYVWSRATSYVISADTEDQETARIWIAEMTEPAKQLQNAKASGKLPVYRSLIDSDNRLSNLLPDKTAQTFPNQAPLDMEPWLPSRLRQLGEMWIDLTTGQLTAEEWKTAWSAR